MTRKTLAAWTLIAAACSSVRMTPAREAQILDAFVPRAAVFRFTVDPAVVSRLEAEVAAQVQALCAGDASARAKLDAAWRELETQVNVVQDDGNVDAMQALLQVETAGWLAASPETCPAELELWRSRSVALSEELMRADLQAQYLLVTGITRAELEELARDARPGPKARLLARVEAMRAGMAWVRALEAEIKSGPAGRERVCGRQDWPEDLPEDVNNALVRALEACG